MTVSNPSDTRQPKLDRWSELRERIAKIAADGPQALEARLAEVNREWTTGRLVKATTGMMLLVGLALTAFHDPWWLALMILAALILIQYWFLPRSWLADLYSLAGFRSGAEIEDERLALRVLRGDFKDLPTLAEIEDRDAVCRLEGEGGIALDTDDEKYEPKQAASLILGSGK
jgi:hypothetical protein